MGSTNYKDIDTNKMPVWSAKVTKTTVPPLTMEMIEKIIEKMKEEIRIPLRILTKDNWSVIIP